MKKVAALLLLIALSISLGYTLGTGGGNLETIPELVAKLIAALLDCFLLFWLERIDQKKALRSSREFDADRKLFDGVYSVVPENLICDLEMTPPETRIDHRMINALCILEARYGGSVMLKFHNKRLQKSFEKFLVSINRFTNFTSVHLFPLSGTADFSLRQGTAMGIEKDKVEFQKLIDEYYSLLDNVASDYRSFMKQGRKYFGC